MKLIVSKGELTLPADFSFEIEQNSAFFSDNGTSSIGATIPATPADQAKLGYPCRIARKDVFVNAFPATIRKGVFQKRGVLVVANATDRSITCSMALEDSELYSQHKGKKLRDVFASKVIELSTPAAAYQWLYGVYAGTEEYNEFRVFPVAVDYDEESDAYEVNNQPVAPTGAHTGVYDLDHAPRNVGPDDDRISVPDGYGIAPFLTLSAFFDNLFTLLGYSVGSNCFLEHSALLNLVLLHNCSDVICNGRIKYADLVPDCTVGDIIDWLQQKFHAQIAVHPEKSSVDIVLMESILTSAPNMDLSRKLTSRPLFSYGSRSRIVLNPDTSLEGAAPAADTLPALISTYGGYYPCDEAAFADPYRSCVILRLSTGDFYEVKGDGTKVRLGSNYFRYDRANSEDAQAFSPADLMPPMVYVDGVLMPYIGKRQHRNTTLNRKEESDRQSIIVADYAGLSTDGTYNYATTSKYDDAGALRPDACNLNAEEQYFLFWRRYGDILLNGSVAMQAGCQLSIAEIFAYDLYSMKLYNGQTLLPTLMKYSVGKDIRCDSLKFILVKDFSDGGGDKPIPDPELLLRWQFNDSELESIKENWDLQYDHWTCAWNPDDRYQVDMPDLTVGPPEYEGQRTEEYIRIIDVTGYDAGGQEIETRTEWFHQWYDAVAIE